MARICARWFFACLLSVIVTAAAQAAPTQSETVRLTGHVPPVLAKATVLPPKAGSGQEQITLTLVLRRDDEEGFERYLRELYDRRSANFHHFLTQQQIADRFGPSRTDYDSVLSYLRSNAFELVDGSANRLTITVRGRRSQVEKALKVDIREPLLVQCWSHFTIRKKQTE